MNPQDTITLLKAASWLSLRPRWKTDPNWQDDEATVRKWYDKEGWKEDFTHDMDNRKHMPQEDFYRLLNRYKLGYAESDDKLRNKFVKNLLDQLRKEGKDIGPEAYKYWLNKDPSEADHDIVEDFLFNDDGHGYKTIFGDGIPSKEVMKLYQDYADEDARAKGYDPKKLWDF